MAIFSNSSLPVLAIISLISGIYARGLALIKKIL
jgi:hypothetical protein